MTPHHDSASFLEVAWSERDAANAERHGYYVRRICACHHHTIVSVRFETEAQAYRCLWAMDRECRHRLAKEGVA